MIPNSSKLKLLIEWRICSPFHVICLKYKIQDRLYIAVLLYKIVLMGTVNFYIYLFFIYKCLNEIIAQKKRRGPLPMMQCVCNLNLNY